MVDVGREVDGFIETVGTKVKNPGPEDQVFQD